MPKFKRKPGIVEAVQMTRELSATSSAWPEWLEKATHKPATTVGSLYTEEVGDDFVWMIRTCCGVVKVGWGDYVVHGAVLGLLPQKRRNFEMIYEAVEE